VAAGDRLWSDGRLALELKTACRTMFEPLECLERLAAMTPRPETAQELNGTIAGMMPTGRRDHRRKGARVGDAPASRADRRHLWNPF